LCIRMLDRNQAQNISRTKQDMKIE
jgi:hypothetical protein